MLYMRFGQHTHTPGFVYGEPVVSHESMTHTANASHHGVRGLMADRGHHGLDLRSTVQEAQTLQVGVGGTATLQHTQTHMFL